MTITWDAITAADIDPSLVSHTPDGQWHICNPDGVWLVSLVESDGWIEVWRDDDDDMQDSFMVLGEALDCARRWAS